MAMISLEQLRHSYHASPRDAREHPTDWALQQLDIDWRDGGAYALLGPSGCGKTTLLNIISGLIKPTSGRVRFDGRDVTELAADARNIAQVFQFPVVYDTMTVYQNLAFPLVNRNVDVATIRHRVHEIADMLDLSGMLNQRASGLTADGKQKISLGRGLVRSDVNVIMFDEPLTVIDPHLKWILRSKLKELHQRIGTTMIYVTHDQTEALTFAEQVVVMYEGKVVQIGTPVELFEQPQHTFVGHFIGSPGMNVLPVTRHGDQVLFGKYPLPVEPPSGHSGAALQVGIRPEFVSFAKQGLPVLLERVSDVGRHRIVEVSHGKQRLKMVVAAEGSIPKSSVFIQFDPQFTTLYADGWAVQ